MSVYYYPSGQYPTSTTQQYRPIASIQYNAQRSQQIPQAAQQAGIYICYSFLQLLTVHFTGETYWLCFIFEFEQYRRKLIIVFFENMIKMKDWETVGGTKQWKNGDCILHHCCPACSAMSSVSVHHITGTERTWAVKPSTCNFVLHHANSQIICKTRHVSVLCQRFAALQTGPVLCFVMVVLHHLLLYLSLGSRAVAHVVGSRRDQYSQGCAAGRGAVTL